MKRGIVESISARTVGRFLNEADLKPHLSRYWLNPQISDPEAFAQEVKTVCDLYDEAPHLAEGGTTVVSCDEKTGILSNGQPPPNRCYLDNPKNENIPIID